MVEVPLKARNSSFSARCICAVRNVPLVVFLRKLFVKYSLYVEQGNVNYYLIVCQTRSYIRAHLCQFPKYAKSCEELRDTAVGREEGGEADKSITKSSGGSGYQEGQTSLFSRSGPQR